MAGAFQATNTKVVSGKPVTEKKKRKRPSKKVPTTVIESSSTNFMDLVQKLTGSAAELASATTDNNEEKLPKSAQSPLQLQASPDNSSSYFQDYLHSAMYNNNDNNNHSYNHGQNENHQSHNDNDSSSSSQQGSQHSSGYAPAMQFPQFLAMDPSSGYSFGGDALDEEELYPASPSSSPRAIENETSLFSSAWRDGSSHGDYWYNQMDGMRA